MSASALLAMGFFVAASAHATPPRTWNYLTTGNGHGFQVYDTNQNKIVTFLDHPYRYLRPSPTNPKSDGVGRRNLAFDFYFGVKTAGGSAWLNAAKAGDPGYVDQSNIIHAPFTSGGSTVDTWYFAPFGYEGNAMVAVIKAPGAQAAYALFNFHLGSTAASDTMPDAASESVRWNQAAQAIIESGPGGGAMVYVPLTGSDGADCSPSAQMPSVYSKGLAGQDLGQSPSCAGSDLVPGLERKLGVDGGWAVAMQFIEDASQADAVAAGLRAWAAGRAPDKILADAQAEFEAWRKPPPASVNATPDELKVWRQGETTLRMGQVREANIAGRTNHGMMLASLPPGEWHTGWVRDGTYATVGLARGGHFAEARASLDFFLNTGPVGAYKSFVNNQDYRISVVRYYGNGQEEADYSGQMTPNVEIDGWGLVLWAARQYVDASGDVAWLSSMTGAGATVYDTLLRGVANPLAENLEASGYARQDSSIWEVHDANKRHFAYTSLAVGRGFCDMATLAARATGHDADKARFQGLYSKLLTGFYAAFADGKGAIPGSLEGLQNNRYTDAAVVEAFNWSLIADVKGRVAGATLDRLNNLVVGSGGYKRNDDNASSYDNNEWIMIDLRMASALRRAGRTAPADALIAQVVDKATANFHLLPELYNSVQADGQIGKYTGSIPMVGYGGGTFIMTLLDRGGVLEPSDCGSSVITDAGVVGTDGGPPIGGGDTADAGPMAPYVYACLCGVGHRGGGAGGPWPLIIVWPWLLIAARLARRAGRRG